MNRAFGAIDRIQLSCELKERKRSIYYHIGHNRIKHIRHRIASLEESRGKE